MVSPHTLRVGDPFLRVLGPVFGSFDGGRFRTSLPSMWPGLSWTWEMLPKWLFLIGGDHGAIEPMVNLLNKEVHLGLGQPCL